MPLRYEKSDRVATITIDNPPVNVFTPALHKDLYEILKDFVADRDVRVGILTGAGTRAFCAGDDIKSPRPERSTGEVIERHMYPQREDDPLEYPGWEAEVLSLTRHKPIVGAVNGPCMGQGFVYLMMLTDLRIAAPEATFGLPEIAYGMGGASGVTRLGRHIAPSAALWLALTGEPFDAKAALHHDLINEIAVPGQLMARAAEIAGRIAAHPPLAVRVEMEAFQRSLDQTRAEALASTGHLYRLQRAAMDPTPPLAKLRKPAAE